MLFSSFGYVYQLTSPCPTLSAHTESNLQRTLLEVTSLIVLHIHAIHYADFGGLRGYHIRRMILS